MDTTRQTTVLFADVSGSTRLYEAAGDARAMEAIQRCLERLRKSAESFGGRVVKTIGDEVMVLFPSPDAAAGASADMQHAIDALPSVDGTKLGVRIGFQYGPVMQRDDDVFGDTVNLAARLVGQAGKGQIITSLETMATICSTWSNGPSGNREPDIDGCSSTAISTISWPAINANTTARTRYRCRPTRSTMRLSSIVTRSSGRPCWSAR